MKRGCGVVAVMALAAACKQSPPSEPPPTPTPTAPTPMRLERAHIDYGVAIPAGVDLDAITSFAKMTAPAASTQLLALTDIFSAEQLPVIVTGLAAADADAFKACPTILLLSTTVHVEQAAATVRQLAKAASSIATTNHGYVIDVELETVVTAADFASMIPDAKPDARVVTRVHAVTGDDRPPFLDTSGLPRFGFPNLYVPAVASGDIDMTGYLVNAAAQFFLDGNLPDATGSIPIDFAKLGWDRIGIPKPANPGCVWKTRMTREAGAAADDDEVIELVPPTFAEVEGIAALAQACFEHVEVPIQMLAEDDPDLLAAGVHARKDLVKLRPHFAKGVPPNERLSVKAPFSQKGSQVEWMWVDVVSFTDTTVRGSLDNVPELVTSLREGEAVTVKLSDVADYVHVHDGTQSGGYSIEIMKQRGLYQP